MIKKTHRFLFYIIVSAIGVASSPLSAFKVGAASVDYNVPLLDSNQQGTGAIAYVGGKIINFLLLIAGILALIYLIYSGILYITAGGDTAKADKGRTGVVNAIIGLVIITAAYVIVRFATGLLNNTPASSVTTNGTF